MYTASELEAIIAISIITATIFGTISVAILMFVQKVLDKFFPGKTLMEKYQ